MSDIARVYANGAELAKGSQDTAKVAPNGKELASNANANLAKITDLSK